MRVLGSLMTAVLALGSITALASPSLTADGVPSGRGAIDGAVSDYGATLGMARACAIDTTALALTFGAYVKMVEPDRNVVDVRQAFEQEAADAQVRVKSTDMPCPLVSDFVAGKQRRIDAAVSSGKPMEPAITAQGGAPLAAPSEVLKDGVQRPSGDRLREILRVFYEGKASKGEYETTQAYRERFARLVAAALPGPRDQRYEFVGRMPPSLTHHFAYDADSGHMGFGWSYPNVACTGTIDFTQNDKLVSYCFVQVGSNPNGSEKYGIAWDLCNRGSIADCPKISVAAKALGASDARKLKETASIRVRARLVEPYYVAQSDLVYRDGPARNWKGAVVVEPSEISIVSADGTVEFTTLPLPSKNANRPRR